ncbi:MAG TPA: SRPBCC family protein [Cellvibrio sp.]|jgi:uncharacterized protein YndB with AHSA1/START domain|nr:SRPBCC family protein [Cellvibrio sp.]
MTTKRSIIMTIALIIIALIAILLIVAATKPDQFRVERTVTINASPEQIFPLINDFRQWTQWSPWEKKDPHMQRHYSDNTSGTGATYAWEGDNNVGHGRMEITESVPYTNIGIALHFIKPFTAHNTATFTLTPTDNGTQVAWIMEGPSPFISKLMQVFISMDKMVGKDFEAGLQQMKTVAEAPERAPVR